MSVQTYCYYCNEDSYSEFDLDCLGSFIRIPGLKEIQYNFAQGDGPTTINCDLNAQIEVCPGVKTQTGLIRGDRCFNESICLVMPEGSVGTLRTYIPNSQGVVDGSVFHEATIQIRCNTTAGFNKETPAVQEYNYPFSILGYTKPQTF